MYALDSREYIENRIQHAKMSMRVSFMPQRYIAHITFVGQSIWISVVPLHLPRTLHILRLYPFLTQKAIYTAF